MKLTLGNVLSSPTQNARWGLVGCNLALLGLVMGDRLGYQSPWRHCLFQAVFGFPSPGCGFTRSLLAWSQGHWQLAVSYHLFAPLLGLLCLVAGGRAIVELSLGRSLQLTIHPALTRLHQTFWHWRSRFLLVALLLLYYLLRLYVRYALPLPSTPPLNAWDWFVIGAKAL